MANKREIVFEFRDILYEQLKNRFGDGFLFGKGDEKTFQTGFKKLYDY